MDFSAIKDIAIPEGNVVKIECGGNVLWQAMALPGEYMQLAWIRAASGVEAYLRLSLCFDTAARVKLGIYIENTLNSHVFGAAEGGGIYRCMISAPYDSGAYARGYGSTGAGYIGIRATLVTSGVNDIEYVLKEGLAEISNTTNGTSGQNSSNIAFSMDSELYLLAQNYNGSARFGDVRRISYFEYYDKNDKLICSLIPCCRTSDGVIGMYDTVRRVFFTNAGSGDFTGLRIFTGGNLVPQSVEADGITVYNGGLGYKNGYRIRSGGAEGANTPSSCTGFIPVKAGDVVRLSGYNAMNTSVDNAINVYDASYTHLGQVVGNAGNGYGIFQEADYKAYNFSSIVEESAGVYTWTVPPHTGIAFMRVTGYTKDGSVMIVTVNEG